MFKNLLIALALLATTVSCNNGLTGQFAKPKQNTNTPTQGALSPSDQKKYTFVLLADSGSIKQAQNGHYQLMINSMNIDKVIAFSVSPYHIAKTSTGQWFANSWNKGVNSFADDPPNAAVVINQDVQTVTLLSLEVIGNQLLFTIKADGVQPLHPISGRTTLFVDWCLGSFCLPCGCSDPSCHSPNSCD